MNYLAPLRRALAEMVAQGARLSEHYEIVGTPAAVNCLCREIFSAFPSVSSSHTASLFYCGIPIRSDVHARPDEIIIMPRLPTGSGVAQ